MVEDLTQQREHSIGNGYAQVSSRGLIIRQKQPANLEMPFDQLDGFLTPTELFYIRSHFPAPEIDPTRYRLQIDGAVKSALSLSYAELREMAAVDQVALLECAGNGRVFLVPQAPGAQWELGAVGNALWTGVRLEVLLERAEIKDDVCEIVLEGADYGTPVEPPVPPEPISYARSLPRQKAASPEVVIAYRMNGRDLTKDHGFPVRAIVPGHYGMGSVKWLTRIHAVRTPFLGYWQTSDYAYWDSAAGWPERRALGEIRLKSEIARPTVYEHVTPNQKYTVYGAAWAGESDVHAIAISTDGGATWAAGEFLDPVQRYAWRRWKFDWVTPRQPGRYTLLARARDTTGRLQPSNHDPNDGSYVITHALPIEVFVGEANQIAIKRQQRGRNEKNSG